MSRIFERSAADFACPVCAAAFTVSGQKSLICAGGHCYDFAAKGYVNFIPNQRQGFSHYTKELFASRAATFGSGAFDRVYLEILDIIRSYFDEPFHINLLDAGCGEGYYAARLSELPGISVFAIDISRDAILEACKRKAPVRWMVADLTRIPLRDGAADVLLNLLASANYEEFSRILSPGGIMIKALPGNSHLKEIREITKAERGGSAYSNEEVMDYLQRRVNVIERRTLRYDVPVSVDMLNHFIGMTPMSFGADLSNLRRSNVSRVTVNMELVVGRVGSGWAPGDVPGKAPG